MRREYKRDSRERTKRTPSKDRKHRSDKDKHRSSSKDKRKRSRSRDKERKKEDRDRDREREREKDKGEKKRKRSSSGSSRSKIKKDEKEKKELIEKSSGAASVVPILTGGVVRKQLRDVITQDKKKEEHENKNLRQITKEHIKQPAPISSQNKPDKDQ